MPNVTVVNIRQLEPLNFTKNIPANSLAVGSPAKVISVDGNYLKHFD